MGIFGPGDFAGEACLADRNPRSMTATSLSPCRLVRIERDAAKRTLREDPVFSERFLAYLLVHNLRVQEDLIDQLLNSSERRLARALLILAEAGEPRRGGMAIPRVSQAVLAEMIGTTRSRVSYFMNRFRKLGHLEYDGVVIVHSTLRQVVPDN